MTAIANVSLNNTFQEQMTTLNQVIVKLAQVESNSVNLVSNSSVIQLSGTIGTGNVIYITSNAYSDNGGTIGGNVVISGNLQVYNVATFSKNVTVQNIATLNVVYSNTLTSNIVNSNTVVVNDTSVLKGNVTSNTYATMNCVTITTSVAVGTTLTVGTTATITGNGTFNGANNNFSGNVSITKDLRVSGNIYGTLASSVSVNTANFIVTNLVANNNIYLGNDLSAGSANAIFLPGGGYISGGVINLL